MSKNDEENYTTRLVIASLPRVFNAYLPWLAVFGQWKTYKFRPKFPNNQFNIQLFGNRIKIIFKLQPNFLLKKGRKKRDTKYEQSPPRFPLSLSLLCRKFVPLIRSLFSNTFIRSMTFTKNIFFKKDIYFLIVLEGKKQRQIEAQHTIGI